MRAVALGDQIIALFRDLGPAGLLVALFVIFYLDSMVIPLLPELFAVIIFQALGPSVAWGILILALAEVAEVLGNTTTYVIARTVRVPRKVQAAMQRWTGVLVAKRETLILTNRIAPAVPFVGFFIAVCGWSYRRSMAYVVLGGLAKYTFLLALVGGLNYAYDPGLAANLTLVLVVAFVAVSLAITFWRRRRLARVA